MMTDRKRILQIEDNPRDWRLASDWLPDVDIIVAVTFSEGVQKYRDGGRFDLVLLDLDLPDTDSPWDTIERAELVFRGGPNVVALTVHRLNSSMIPLADVVHKKSPEELPVAVAGAMLTCEKNKLFPALLEALDVGVFP